MVETRQKSNMTNFVQKGVKAAPLSKLLRQLKIRYDELDLVEQSYSLIEFPGIKVRFANDFGLMAEDIRKEFPSEIDGFLKLVDYVKNYNDVKPGDQIEVYERTQVARSID